MAMNNIYQDGAVGGGVRLILQAEGLAAFILATLAYSTLQGSWWQFGGLFFVPDIAFLAYLVNPRIGATAYNGLHSYLGPACAGLWAHFTQTAALLPVALIWAAHIGFDRAVGYGLKYPAAFGRTHLGFKGKAVA